MSIDFFGLYPMEFLFVNMDISKDPLIYHIKIPKCELMEWNIKQCNYKLTRLRLSPACLQKKRVKCASCLLNFCVYLEKKGQLCFLFVKFLCIFYAISVTLVSSFVGTVFPPVTITIKNTKDQTISVKLFFFEHLFHIAPH